MLFRVKSSESKLQEGYRTQILLLMVWRILSQSFRTTELNSAAAAMAQQLARQYFFYIYISFSSALLYILLPWQLNTFCPSVWWQNRYIHLFRNLVFKRQIIFSQLLYVFKALFRKKQNIAASLKERSINHTTQALCCPGDALNITHRHHKWKSQNGGWWQGPGNITLSTRSLPVLTLLITISNITT